MGGSHTEIDPEWEYLTIGAAFVGLAHAKISSSPSTLFIEHCPDQAAHLTYQGHICMRQNVYWEFR